MLVAASTIPGWGQELAQVPDEPPNARNTAIDSDGELAENTKPPPAGNAADSQDDILNLDIDQLAKVEAKVPTAFDTEVTSVTRHESSVGKSPAAVFVITQEMIRRSGATSIPETFRMVPGMQVAKIGSSKWAISIRGFNDQFANKLLVMVDGRSVYTPFFAGVFWETQDLVLQDIERIEVIRGPGATVWGANAVNGVINIVTRKSSDTQGTLISGGGGDQDRLITAARHGGQINDETTYRVYAKYRERNSGFNPGGGNDDWQQGRTGFRIDWDDPCKQDFLTLQGDIYFGDVGEKGAFAVPTPPFVQPFDRNTPLGGGNVVGRWTRKFDEDNSFTVQAFYDRQQQRDFLFDFGIDVYDLDFQHTFQAWDAHTITWGGGYRLVSDVIRADTTFSRVDPYHRNYSQVSAFIQDELPLYEDRLKLVLGSKFMHFDFTGFEYQPGARLLWNVDEHQAVWGAVSRAVRTPSRLNEDALITVLSAPFPSFFSLQGSHSLVSEEQMSYELGYRSQVNDALSWEVATYYNVYRDLIDLQPIGFTPGFPPTVRTQWANIQNADVYGIELSGQWEITEKWRLRGWYALMQMNLQGGSADAEGRSPHNQAYLMSSWDLPCKFEFDLMPRYVDTLSTGSVPAYTTMDARLGWRPNENWEFSVVGQNLLDEHHLEFVGFTTIPSAVNRGVFAQVIWRH